MVAFAPDEIVQSIIEGICVSDDDGIAFSELWQFVQNKLQQEILDDFYKKLIWMWLFGTDDFLIYKIKDIKTAKNGKQTLKLEKLAKSPSFKNYSKLIEENGEDKIRLKVDENREAIFLTGNTAENNKLGKFPYQLLKIIAGSREKGITSPELSLKSGQDKRSLTGRLQTLETAGLVKRFVYINKVKMYISVHTKYLDKFTSIPRFDPMQTAIAIVSFLEKAPGRVRGLHDLRGELNLLPNRSELRRFQTLTRKLVLNGIIQVVVILNEETSRRYVGIKLLKELPKGSSLKEILERVDDNDEDEDDGASVDQEFSSLVTTDTVQLPQYNPFFSLPSQIYDLVEANPTISKPNAEKIICGGVGASRIISNTVDAMCVEEYTGKDNCIVKLLHVEGKARSFKLLTVQDYLAAKKQEFTEKPVYDVMDGDRDRCLVEYSRDLFDYILRRKIKLIRFNDGRQLVWFGSNEDKFVVSNVSKFPEVAKFVVDHETYELDTIKNKLIALKDHENVNIKESLEEPPRETSLELIAPNFEELQHLTAASEQVFSQDDPVQIDQIVRDITGHETNPDETTTSIIDTSTIDFNKIIDIDFGPAKRREILLNYIDEVRCCVVNQELMKIMSEKFQVNYTMDRKTILKDATKWAEQDMIRIISHQPPGWYKPLSMLVSIKNPPSEKDIEEMDKYHALPFHNKSEKKNKLSTAPTVNFNEVHFHKVPIVPPAKIPDKSTKSQRLMESSKRSQERLKKSSKSARRGKSKLEREFEDMKDGNENVKELQRVNRTARKTKSTEETQETLETQEVQDEGDTPVVKKRRKRRAALNDQDDLLTPLMRDKKRKVISKKHKDRTATSGARRQRTNTRLQSKDLMILVRCIVIVQSLNNSQGIDWQKISDYFGGKYSSDVMRRLWPKHKKIIGFGSLEKSRRNWEKILMSAIENGEVELEDLEDVDLTKMIELWKSVDFNVFNRKYDVELYADYDENFRDQRFEPHSQPRGTDIFRDTLSMVEREEQLAKERFLYPVTHDEEAKVLDQVNKPTEVEVARAKLKALFATGIDKFSSDQAKKLFGSMSNRIYSKALSDLEDDKAIAYLGDFSKTKFMLTEKLMGLFEAKLDESFLESAVRFHEVTADAGSVKKGIILSTLCPDGAYVPIVNFVANKQIELTRIDQKKPVLETYSTKAQERSRLESDFIVSKFKDIEADKIKSIAPPTGVPCSRIWVDLQGDFNKVLFFKCIATLLRAVVYHPGVPLKLLIDRMNPVLEAFEVKILLDWLVAKNALRAGEHSGYWLKRNWYMTFHNAVE